MSILQDRQGKLFRSAINTPSVYAVIVGCVAFVLPHEFVAHHKDEYLKDILGAAINLGAIALGFLMTAKSILFTASNTTQMRAFKASDEFKDLMGLFARTMGWLLTLVLASMVLMAVISVHKFEPIYFVALAAWVAILAGACAAAVLCVELYLDTLSLDYGKGTPTETTDPEGPLRADLRGLVPPQPQPLYDED
jgi:hypothetical protein